MYQIISQEFETVTADMVNAWIEQFNANILPEVTNLNNYYFGKNAITKQGSSANRPNYSINVNMAKYITDVATSYFMGKAVTYSADTDAAQSILDVVDPIYILNDEAGTNMKLAGEMSTSRQGFELLYFDDGEDVNNKIKFMSINPLNAFIVYKNTIDRKPLAGVYIDTYVLGDKTITTAYVYTATTNYIFEGEDGKLAAKKDGETPNLFGDIALRAVANNDDVLADYESVLDLLDALSLVVSNTTDDLQSIANAILAISGGQLDTADIQAINDSKVASLCEGGKMEWVIKNINTDAVKTQVEQLQSFILMITQTPDLTDEAFAGNSSGVAMEYKLWGLEQLRAAKEKEFRPFLLKRIELILNAINKASNDKMVLVSEINIDFHKNLPRNMTAEYEMVENLRGLVSDETLLAKLSIIEDAQAELERLDAQKAKEAEDFGFGTSEVTTEVE